MKKVTVFCTFERTLENQVEVTVDGDKYGTLIFDHEQNAWVLWIMYIDDGISFWEDLAETEESVTDAVQNYSVDSYIDN